MPTTVKIGVELNCNFCHIMLELCGKGFIMKAKNYIRKKTKKALEKLKNIGFFSVSEAYKAGISKSTLSRLVSRKIIFRVGHGIYFHPESNISPEEQDYIKACLKFGEDAVIGGITALFYHHLIEQVPHVIWVIVPQKKQTRDKFYRLIRVKSVKKEGIEKHKYFKITNIERTIVEAFVYKNKIGIRIAMQAITKAIKEGKTDLNKIMKMAKTLGYEKIMQKHWESIIGALQG